MGRTECGTRSLAVHRTAGTGWIALRTRNKPLYSQSTFDGEQFPNNEIEGNCDCRCSEIIGSVLRDSQLQGISGLDFNRKETLPDVKMMGTTSCC